MKSARKSIAVMSLFFLLLACSSNRLSRDEWELKVNDSISQWQLESVKKVNTFRLDSWASLGEKHLILRTSPGKPYLVELDARCPQLHFARALMLDQAMSTSLDAGFDSVFTAQEPHIKCRIKTIYPLNREQDKALLALDKQVAED
ncbi:DUF6491 family protein [Shewanella zhangzhouensis]|uniref:DUF6491 family protein n=1 Tax=Shewanella zhangzhouensis TaxID=2864213 RepID=UPI001C662242|nr:DUF6491 family protein [Shewanella zhangzhouensis]QYK05209.1 hypothetical protein K0H63_19545 [Shewanella zhangzhouensis]